MSARLVRDLWRLSVHRTTNSLLPPTSLSFVQTRGYPSQIHEKIRAANEKRNRIRKMQKSQEVTQTFVERINKKLKKTLLTSKRFSRTQPVAQDPPDDVFLPGTKEIVEYSLEDALELHRRYLHPHMLNLPNNLLMASFQFNMHSKKQGRYLVGFEGNVFYPHLFEAPSRITRIICFCSTSEEQTAALMNGADEAGGEALVKKCLAAEVDVLSFDYVLSTFEMLPALAPLKTILKQKMPAAGKTQRVSDDAAELTKLFRESIPYEVKGDSYEPDLGLLRIPIGTLNMPTEHIGENVKILFEELNRNAPRGRPPNKFISEVFLESPPSPESFLLDKTPYLIKPFSKTKMDQEADEEDPDES